MTEAARELLELAAKGCGYELFWDDEDTGLAFIRGSCKGCQAGKGDPPADCAAPYCMEAFSPLTDDGDAFRLAVKLGIPCWRDSDIIWCNHVASVVGSDPYADMRLAIVRAAAKIGRRQ